MFDVLVHLHESGEITLEHHFDEALDTHVIDSLNGTTDWYYAQIYDGGFGVEEQYHRIDYALIKDRMTVEVRRYSAQDMATRQTIWATEVSRRQAAGGSVTIPDVSITGPDGTRLNFTDVVVTAHNLRNDVFANGAITAIDVVLSLCDQGHITSLARWRDTVGGAEVKDYFVDGINSWQASGSCGFTYGLGEHANSGDFSMFGGNDVHIPMDIRLIHNPEYIELSWTELGPC